MKLTKRKGFNFFRSYYDVYNELDTHKDKVAFIDALFDRQFLGIRPTKLTGMAKFAYISQTNSIDSQVKGYEDKTKSKLTPHNEEINTPTVGGRQGGLAPPTLQVEEKEKEKGEYIDVELPKTKQDKDLDRYKLFLTKWNEIKNSRYKGNTNDLVNFNFWLKTYTPTEIIKAVENHDTRFWAEKINPQWLFRTKDTKGQPVDYIGQLLEHVNRSKLRV